MASFEQDDLTADDHKVANTGKVFEPDDELPQPSQDPNWIPEGSV